jgi:hypothetical protein
MNNSEQSGNKPAARGSYGNKRFAVSEIRGLIYILSTAILK